MSRSCLRINHCSDCAHTVSGSYIVISSTLISCNGPEHTMSDYGYPNPMSFVDWLDTFLAKRKEKRSRDVPTSETATNANTRTDAGIEKPAVATADHQPQSAIDVPEPSQQGRRILIPDDEIIVKP
ncbi:hypothetical protein BAUCODRAFT_415250 [Baudoinia panamericana UAMH 10762]|uniref:Uncharacterized protein n=1 Tax=Baudoinia panamericana (strain UAMH 10762) TaxID=717646 RepID=M2N2L6_BAUPA|nr:uncharacterized protein BAUCODRAFT_415250 [Baudoinia panamericana UAMH 10762]EMC98178.1 hypothetical protein BAUCODRAFT_415250 [Baudoinia panamericana UAMH 10762]